MANDRLFLYPYRDDKLSRKEIKAGWHRQGLVSCQNAGKTVSASHKANQCVAVRRLTAPAGSRIVSVALQSTREQNARVKNEWTDFWLHVSTIGVGFLRGSSTQQFMRAPEVSI